MKEGERSDEKKNKPLVSFLIHGIVVVAVFAVLGGAVVYWIG